MFKKEIPEEDIINSYKSWRGNITKYDSHNMVIRTDELLKECLNVYNSEIHRD